MYLNALSETVWGAASPPSGNNNLASKTICLICVSIHSSLSSTAQGFIPTRINPALACILITPLTFGNYLYIPRQFVSRSLLPLLLRFIALLVILHLFEPVCSCVASVFHFVSLTKPVCSCVALVFYLASFTEPVCSCIPFIVSIASCIYSRSSLSPNSFTLFSHAFIAALQFRY
jgi:hypothetical protein